jgi:hypothetical protein
MTQFLQMNYPRISREIEWWLGRRNYSTRRHPSLLQASGRIFKDDVNGFSSTSDICFMGISVLFHKSNLDVFQCAWIVQVFGQFLPYQFFRKAPASIQQLLKTMPGYLYKPSTNFREVRR